MEACGTSGMKAALNGVPSLSILDGWWPEAFGNDNGWAFEHAAAADDPSARDAEAMYDLLEKIIPIYYRMNDRDFPHEWVQIMKSVIKSCAAQFSARRMVKEYISKFYGPALAAADDSQGQVVSGIGEQSGTGRIK
jgi:starch phosphorylase